MDINMFIAAMNEELSDTKPFTSFPNDDYELSKFYALYRVIENSLLNRVE